MSHESASPPPAPRIWIDADACPGEVKAFILRTAQRRQLPVCLVANRPLTVPLSALVSTIRVARDPDAVDTYIVQHVESYDLVITADIPLAAAVVDRQALALSPRGELYTSENVYERLATRNLLQHLRASGLVTGGPAPLSATDQQHFAAALDRAVTRLLKARAAHTASQPERGETAHD
ncbi:MAG: YaiI/YqxD family protein [Candidatus Tectimicrobiota bacterium]